MMNILDLPRELLSHILSFLEPTSLIHFGQTCKPALEFVNPRHQILWRSAFLHVFDDPHDTWTATPGFSPDSMATEFDWHRELTTRLLALRDLRNWSRGARVRADNHIGALLNILDTAKFTPTPSEIAKGNLPREDDRSSSLNLQVLTSLDQHREGVESLIHDLGAYPDLGRTKADDSAFNSPGRPITRSMTLNEHEKSRLESAARLHVLYGLTNREQFNLKSRGAARRKVYDWSQSNQDNDYGPFKRNGSGQVDWFLLEGVYSVITRNFSLCVDGRIAMPQGFCYSIPHRTLIDPTIPQDWARVSGSWLGTYSFLDYADLFAFNTWDDGLGARPTLDDEPEDCGDLMKLELKLDDTLALDSRLMPSLPISTVLPPLFFSGLSRGYAGMHRPVIGVRGSACLVPGGREVRWKFIINYGGQDQWQLEGVQPGGIRSGGIFGLWTQCDHEDNGPVGPFCYFPMELCKPTSVVLVA